MTAWKQAQLTSERMCPLGHNPPKSKSWDSLQQPTFVDVVSLSKAAPFLTHLEKPQISNP